MYQNLTETQVATIATMQEAYDFICDNLELSKSNEIDIDDAQYFLITNDTSKCVGEVFDESKPYMYRLALASMLEV